jgi:nitrate/nitrite transporter NarK
MFRHIFKGYIFLDVIGNAIFTAVVFVVTCIVIYIQQLYENTLHLLIAVAIAVAAGAGFVNSIKEFLKLYSKKDF